jgi:hypothetical protein
MDQMIFLLRCRTSDAWPAGMPCRDACGTSFLHASGIIPVRNGDAHPLKQRGSFTVAGIQAFIIMMPSLHVDDGAPLSACRNDFPQAD